VTVHDSLNQAIQRNQSGQWTEAESICRQILQQQPDFAPAHYHLGNALKQQGRLEEAIASYRRATAIQPDYPQALNNMGNALRQLGRSSEALASLRRAADLAPDSADFQFNLGNMLRDMDEINPAMACFRRAAQLRPDMAAAHWNLANLLLLKGDYAAGWPEFQWRRRVPGLEDRSQSDRPEWNGQPLNGKRILIHADQGLGATIHLFRYLPMVAERGGRIIVACDSRLIRLFRYAAGALRRAPLVEEWAVLDQRIPHHEVQAAWTSLPGLFGTRVDTIPTGIPYLSADPELSRRWQDRLRPDGRLKVGLTWAGRPTPDPNRSIPTEFLTPLQSPRVRLISLQQRPSDEQVPFAPPAISMENWSDEFQDLSDTAALIDNLDLVITIDTVIAHLAGAMGKKTWILLMKQPDWRWMLDRSDSLWYPSVRLFRQTRSGDWTGPVDAVAKALSEASLLSRQS
jgi:hypothetical protein